MNVLCTVMGLFFVYGVNSLKKFFIRGLLILIAAAALCAGGWCVWYLVQYYQGQSFGEEIRESGPKEETVIHVPTEPEQPDIEEPEPEPKPETIVIPVNFDELHEINTDIYAWIDIPGTDISYAVLHREGNNAFYMKHREDGSYYSGGSIFSEDYNSTDFSDKLTVLYGHNMRNDKEFSRLNDFSDVSVFDEYQYINIYFPDRALVFKVFAACPHSNEHLMIEHDFTDREDFETFFADLLETRSMDAQFREDEFPSYDEDKILVRSTCYRQDKHQRFLVCGRLVKELPAETD